MFFCDHGDRVTAPAAMDSGPTPPAVVSQYGLGIPASLSPRRGWDAARGNPPGIESRARWRWWAAGSRNARDSRSPPETPGPRSPAAAPGRAPPRPMSSIPAEPGRESRQNAYPTDTTHVLGLKWMCVSRSTPAVSEV